VARPCTAPYLLECAPKQAFFTALKCATRDSAQKRGHRHKRGGYLPACEAPSRRFHVNEVGRDLMQDELDLDLFPADTSTGSASEGAGSARDAGAWGGDGWLASSPARASRRFSYAGLVLAEGQSLVVGRRERVRDAAGGLSDVIARGVAGGLSDALARDAAAGLAAAFARDAAVGFGNGRERVGGSGTSGGICRFSQMRADSAISVTRSWLLLW
jgi:hypothetical protein